jgi:Tol biopolymer transport system component
MRPLVWGRRSVGSLGAVGAACAVGLGLAGAAQGQGVLLSKQDLSLGGAAADEISESVSVSGDGSAAAFVSRADNLSPDDPDREYPLSQGSVFLRLPAQNATSLISRVAGGGSASGPCERVELSANGRYAAFSCLKPGQSSGRDREILVRDLATHTTSLVSRRSGAIGEPANGDSVLSSISADGRFLVLLSSATNLSRRAVRGRAEIYVRDTRRQVTSLVPMTRGRGGNFSSEGASISGSGRFVAYVRFGPHRDGRALQPGAVFRFDRATGRRVMIDRRLLPLGQSSEPQYLTSLSRNGRFVAFATTLGARESGGGFSVIMLWDARTGRKRVVSQLSSGRRIPAVHPSLSGSGRRVAWSGRARLRVDAPIQVFVRDLRRGRTVVASRGFDGGLGNDWSRKPDLSQDGRMVGFVSDANNLVPGITSDFPHVFLAPAFAAAAGKAGASPAASIAMGRR